jgi:hypothetical protein
MLNLGKMIIDGVVLSVLASCYLMLILRIDPRLFLQDYPQAIQAKVAAKTAQEGRLSLILGIPFLLILGAVPFISTLTLKAENSGSIAFLSLFLNAFGVSFSFNLVDWLVLDWIIFCTITPRFLVIPGTEGMDEYKDYRYHFRGFLIGTIISGIAALIIAVVVSFL